MDKVLYVHSRCCNAHWELVVVNGKYVLQCEVCGKEGFKIVEPKPNHQGCEECKKQGKGT